MRNFRARALLAATLLVCCAHEVSAGWFDGGEASKAEKLVSTANAQLQEADEVWRSGNMSKAAEGYQAAEDSYRQADQLVPNMENGLIRFRIAYCANQVEQIQNAAREKAKPEPVAVTHPPALTRRSEGSAPEPARGPAAPPRWRSP